MNIGFIGAGKVGCTLGLHLIKNSKSSKVTGYYDTDLSALQETVDITDTKMFKNLTQVIEKNDIIFITVTDAAIEKVWKEVKVLPIKGKIICHCSGSLSSAIFSGIDQCGALGYSVHPLFACSSKANSYKQLPKSVFTIEGNEEKLEFMKELLEKMGNKVQVISKDVKSKYHAAAVVTSNLMLGLAKVAQDMLVDCGFSKENASKALNPLIENNISNLLNDGVQKAMTGPIERNDVCTIQKHMTVLDNEQLVIYKALSKVLVDIAKEKNKDKDYDEMIKILK